MPLEVYIPSCHLLSSFFVQLAVITSEYQGQVLPQL